MKITLIGSHHLADGYLGAANALRRLDYEVEFLPATAYKNEFPKSHVKMLNSKLKKSDSDAVLWWRSESLNASELAFVKKACEKPFILYSWDDPLQWENDEIDKKCASLDMAFSCCKDSLEMYKKNGCKMAFYAPPGFDPEVHYPEEDENYKCDISMVCTNLYEDPNITSYPHINRRDLINAIINFMPDLDFRIYGPEDLGNKYPLNYKGWIRFDESRKVFHNSKINLCTHIRPDGFMYMNERVAQVLGSGGLLMVDKVNGIENILDLENECTTIDFEYNNTISGKIKDILKNYDKYEQVKANGLKKAKEELTWDNWAQIVDKNIKKENILK